MTTVSKSDILKTKKPETNALISGVASGRKLSSKTRTVRVSKTLKRSSDLDESKCTSNEVPATNKIKLANTTNTAAKNAKTGRQRDSDRSTITESSRRYWNVSTRFNENKYVGNEVKATNKTKLVSTSHAAVKNAKIGEQRGSDPSIITGSSQTNGKLNPRSVSTSSQDKNATFRAKQLSKTTKGKTSTLSYKAFNSMTEKKSAIPKKNSVLDTSHNVTVSSPPSKRRGDLNDVASNSDQKIDASKLNRKGSRTLTPDEIVVLKKDSAKLRSEEAIRKETSQNDRNLATGKKEPVAFEIKFDEMNKKETQNRKEKIKALEEKQKSDEETVYSDDFESYESDFETGSSSHSLLTSSAANDDNRKLSEEAANQEDSSSQITPDDSEHEDGTEPTQRRGLEIQTDKERKLDSGNYDTSLLKRNSLKPLDSVLQYSQPCTANWETTTLLTTEQMDSGISTYATSIPPSDDKKNSHAIYGGYRYFYEQPIISSRGCELQTKIQFDVLKYILFELRPISYEVFMQTFGKINTTQNFAQTVDNRRNEEQQTEIHGMRTVWTQHPPQFVLETSNNYDKIRMCKQLFCGEVIECNENQVSTCELERNLNSIKQLTSQCSKRIYQNRQKKPINYQLLYSFLLRSSFLIEQILGSSKVGRPTSNLSHNIDQALKHVCERSFYMATNFLNKLRVVKVFANNKFNLLVTVHESLPDTNAYRSDFANLLIVWCTNTCDRPMRLLTSWSEVSKVEIPNDYSDIIVAALSDGSVALWDLREIHSYCPKLDGYLTHYPTTQSIVPSYTVEGDTNKLEVDLGACLDVKSFRNITDNIIVQPKFPQTQFASLHESGIATVWTLVQTAEINYSLGQPKQQSEQLMLDSISPWARVKLMQSSIVNIRQHLERKSNRSQSRFESTKGYFERNIYSDECLRELSEALPEVGRQRILFTSLECGSENLFICTNLNYVLMCSKTLKMTKLKRIFIDESQFLFPTALKLLNDERFLAVGLCNGVVMILNCQPDKDAEVHKEPTKKSELSQNFDDDKAAGFNDSVTSKSCAIQNILLNAQKSYEQIDAMPEYRSSTAACTTSIESKSRALELNIIDQEIIISGSTLKQNLIQHLELSSDGWYLFALTNGHIKVYDFYMVQEFPSEDPTEPGEVIGLTTGTCGCKENSLMILRPNTELQVIILKQD